MNKHNHNHLGSFIGLISFGVVIVYVLVSSAHLLNNILAHLVTR